MVVAQAIPAAAAAAASAPASASPSLADAFADLKPASAATASPAAGAVDIAALTPRRRVAAAAPVRTPPAAAKPGAEKPKPKLKPKVEKPAEPARIWVQIGVGRNTAAFAFDWRKLTKQAGGALDGNGPWAVKYGATNRMLAGPFATDSAAKAAIKRLKDKGIEALPFTSAEGEKVTKIG